MVQLKQFILICIYMCVCTSVIANQPGAPILLSKIDARLSFETIPVSDSESMGMVGVHMELKNLADIGYLGVGGYGALTGDRGGFFTAGITPGIQYKLPYLGLLDVGLFLGGGGGASAFPGDGLMLRYHAYLQYQLNRYAISTGLSWQSISHKSVGVNWVLTCSRPFYVAIQKKAAPNVLSYTWLNKFYRQLEISALSTHYFPISTNMGRNETSIESRISILQLDVARQWTNQLYGLFSLGAANGNGADGYGVILSGVGYKVPVYQFNLLPYVKLGMSGGGNLDSGGGFLWNLGLMSQIKLNRSFALSSTVGYIDAPTGHFSTWQFGIGLSYNIKQLTPKNAPVVPNNYAVKHTHSDIVKRVTWFIEQKTVFPLRSILTKSNQQYEPSIQFFGCGFRVPFSSSYDALVHTYWAYLGDVGAYAEGGFGVVKTIPLSSKWFSEIQASISAAGGGGIDVNQGTIHQESVNIGYNITNKSNLLAKFGWQGSFSTNGFKGPIALITWQKKVFFY